MLFNNSAMTLKSNHRLLKRFSLMLLLAAFSLVAATPALAAVNDIVTSTDGTVYGCSGFSSDTPHGTIYGLDAKGTYVMNLATDSNRPSSGTKVTTWTYTGHESQYWDTWRVIHPDHVGGYVLLVNANFNLALNINRATHEVNVVDVIGNYYRDCTLFPLAGIPDDGVQFYVKARLSGETSFALVGTRTVGARFTWQKRLPDATVLYRIGA